MTVPEYTAGEWTAVVRPGFVALLDPQVPASTVRAVWAVEGRGVLGTLAVLAREGFAGLPSFALVAVDGRRVHVALRGDVEVVLGADVLASGAVSTWTERVVEDAPGVVVRVAGAAAGDELPLAEGVVRASAVRVALLAQDAVAVVGDVAVDATAPDEVDGLAAAGAASDDAVLDEAAADGDADEAEVDETDAVVTPLRIVAPLPVDEADADADVDEPAVAAVVPVDWSAASTTLEPEPVEESLVELEPLEPGDADLDEPVAVPGDAHREAGPADVASDEPTPAAVPWFPTHAGSVPAPSAQAASEVVAAAEALLHAPVTVEGASPDDHDGMTIMSADLASIRDQLPAWAGDDARPELVAPPSAPVPVVVPARMVLSTGVVVELDRAVLVGRAPQVSRVTNRELPRLVTVPSPQQDISRTHAEVRLEGDVVLVTDLDSTNGVHVSRPGQGARRLHPGEPSVVDLGEVVDLGDGVTFTVERGA